METCLQIALQTYISGYYFAGKRMTSTSQTISLYQSYLTVLFTLTKVWLPQLVGSRQYVSTLKTKVWQFALNLILFFSLIFTLNVIHINSSAPFEQGYFHNIFISLLYLCIGSTFLSSKNCFKKFEQTKTLKLCLLSLLFLVKIAFDCLLLYKIQHLYKLIRFYFSVDYIPLFILTPIQHCIIICNDAFLAYIFGKSALKMHSISSIWNMEPTIVSKPVFYTCLFLAVCTVVWKFCLHIVMLCMSRIHIKDVNI